MKKYLYIFCTLTGAALMGCTDLDLIPEDTMAPENYFSSEEELRQYTNAYYGMLPGADDLNDICADDVIKNILDNEILGNRYPSTEKAWDWDDLRVINYYFENSGACKDQNARRHYDGFSYFMRAYFYFTKVQRYGDVPYYDEVIGSKDEELLYKPRDSRKYVMQKVVEDLDSAIYMLPETKTPYEVNKWTALALKSRATLFEGTFRKYHPELKLNDGDRFLKIAVEACQKIMDTKSYSLSTTKESGLPAYQSLFCSTDLTQNPEMILVADYDKALGRLHNAQAQFDYNTGLSRSLMEDYLVVKDGHTEYFHQVEGYKTKTVLEVFENRDPRLEQTFMKPGVLSVGTTEPHRTKLNLGGYPQIKFRPLTFDQIDWGKSYTDLPIIRYAEVLLMYAEAKAELGILTQDDVNQTINLIRQRAGMPDASLDDWLANIDPVQDERYSNVQSAQKGAVLEVRRERRIELACEGFRYGDLMRWGCGKLFEAAPEGAYIPGMGYYDVTGDGQPDVAIVEKKADIDKIPEEDKQKYKLTVYALEGNTIGLTEGTKGYIYLVAQHNKYTFVSPKYYYYPVATKDITVNENLYQNPFWE